MTPKELGVLSAYAEWASHYPPRAHNALMRAEEKTLLEIMPDPRGKIALDLACGTGRYARILRERNARAVFGIDLSREMLAQTNSNDAAFARGDLLNIPFPNSFFEIIVCGLALGHVENLTQAIGESARVLKRGGIIVYSDFHPLGYLAGWRREFSSRDGKRHAVKHFAHLYADHALACRAAGLTITAVREPIIGREIREEFPGSDSIYRQWRGWPAVLVLRAEKI
ncbi:MAG: class I SAM-dependent methyltransferase [Chloroflexi bacterium]|nr:class I SAM-dependent methyltransferase [Chloroflexota bacterium]